MLTPGQVITSPDGVNGTEIPVGATVKTPLGNIYTVIGNPGLPKLIQCAMSGNAYFGRDTPMTILTLPPGYGAEAGPDAGDELAEAVGRFIERLECRTFTRDSLDTCAIQDAKAALTRYLSTRPAKGGGA